MYGNKFPLEIIIFQEENIATLFASEVDYLFANIRLQ
jgi:hypothetical protein